MLKRDRLPCEGQPRAGVPQGRHLHTLLARGGDILERLFPGFPAALDAAGASRLDATADVVNLSPKGWVTNRPSGLLVHNASRPLIEALVRTRVAAHPRVAVRDDRQVLGLLADAGGAVIGVRTRPGRPGLRPGDGDEDIRAALVVDAGGRAAGAIRWLRELGYDAPRETVIDSLLGYASGYFAVPPIPKRR